MKGPTSKHVERGRTIHIEGLRELGDEKGVRIRCLVRGRDIFAVIPNKKSYPVFPNTIPFT